MKKLFLWICLILCIFCGCKKVGGKTVTLYFATADGQEMATEQRTVSDSADLLEEAVRELLKGPKSPTLLRTIPEGTELIGTKTEGTVAEINLSEAFDTGSDTERLLARYALIYTACSVEDVKKVKITVNGKPVTSLRDGALLGALGMEDLSEADFGGGARKLITLYFANADGTKLVPEERQVELKEGENAETAAIRAIIEGPSSSSLVPTVSADTQLLSAETREGVCFVNLSRTFYENNTGGTSRETMAVYSIVNSLCALPDVREVRFLIEGETHETFGSLIFSEAFSEDSALVE